MTEQKKTILLVDDEKHLLVSLRDYLSYENFEVLTARSGEDALRVLEKSEPNLIVLDISMPGMGGVGFLKHISSEDGIPRYPVLVLTARGAMRDFFDAVAVDGFLEKPCEEADLIRKIRKILANREQVRQDDSGGQRRILLAEDDVGIASRVGEVLAAEGYAVDTVRSGPEILDRAPGFKPHLILLKEILPKLNGSAVASLIDVMPSISMIPVILYDDTRADAADAPWRGSENKCVRKTLATSSPVLLAKAAKELLG